MNDAPTDEEINYRLFSVINFVPCDNFKYIRDKIRSGRIFLVVKNPKNTKQIIHCMMIELKD